MTQSFSTPTPQAPWFEANQRYLMAEVNQLRQMLEQKMAQLTAQTASTQAASPASEPLLAVHQTTSPNIQPPPVLNRLCEQFALSAFERQILLLCAGVELSRPLVSLCAALHGNPQQAYPTFGLAFSLFPEGHWAAVTPDAPLRRWQMIEIMAGAELTGSPLRIDEHILHKLMGILGGDPRLQGIVKPLPNSFTAPLPASHQQIAGQIAEQIAPSGLMTDSQTPVIQLWGEDGATKQAIALAAATQHQRSLHVIEAEALPSDRSQVNQLQCLWERESLLNQSVLLLNCDHLPTATTGEAAQLQTIVARLIENNCRPLIITSRDRLPQRQRPFFDLEVSSPTPCEQRQLWHTHLGETAISLNGHIDQLVTYFNLSASAIQMVCKRLGDGEKAGDRRQEAEGRRQELEVRRQESGARSQEAEAKRQKLGARQEAIGKRLGASVNVQDLLWRHCLEQARPALGELAQRMILSASWEDLVLPKAEFQVLQTIAAHVRQRTTVYEHWGFADRGSRGLGISALFAGSSGTGKTLAAEVLANELKLDLYRIDLSTVVSKYIGETEKNLRRIFDGAEQGGAILLFDEADALFGKRSEVKDARDRYANMEVAYLLQRIEAFRGLAILTTNLKDSLDQAFLRRIRFVVQFPFPDATHRERIWRCSFPPQTPLESLNFKTLAKFNIAGGNIRNIALNAAFLAADAAESVGMKHIIKAAQNEYIKLERPLTELRDRDIKQYLPELKD
ncbi:MAG: ATP-binding protein [Cyanobacteria bacterium J06639_14]